MPVTACKRKLLHYLLILSLGLMPATVLAMDEMQHMDTMSTGSTNCEQMTKLANFSCGHESCMSMAHVCGANFSSGFIPASFLGDSNRLRHPVNYLPDEIRYRSRLDDSIYRPPIA